MTKQGLAVTFICGWLLMLPPPDGKGDGKWRPDLDAAIREWNHFKAFDSARECEDARISNLEVFPKDEPDPEGKTAPGRNRKATRDRYQNARCVPAESVY